MKNESKFEWAIGLMNFSDLSPPSTIFERFYEISKELLLNSGTHATHVIANGKGYSGKWVKHGGAATQKLLDSQFHDISLLGLCHNPPFSNAPGSDRVAKCVISYSKSFNSLSLTVVFNDSAIEFQSSHFNKILERFFKFLKWDAGWSLSGPIGEAEWHVICIGNGEQSHEETTALNRWFASTSEERLAKPRDVYPVNVLHSNHLKLMIGGKTLGEFIREVPGTRVEVIAGHTVWTMPPEMVDGLREKLGAVGILIARG